MGWDVVQIGLRHNLPVHDPFATAKEVAKRMKKNIRLVYINEYEYDKEKNVVSEVNDYELIELGKFEVNNSNDYLQMTVSDYQKKHIRESVGIDKLRKATFVGEFADFILSGDSFELYEIEDNEGTLYIRIFKENIDLDVCVDGRWYWWEKAFHSTSQENQEWLHNYRMKIYHQAKMFGCQEVIICSDQGPTMLIYDNMEYPADKLKEYAQSFQYLKDTTWEEESEKEDWKKNAKQILFSSYFQNQLDLSGEGFVEVIYDDFNDIENMKTDKEYPATHSMSTAWYIVDEEGNVGILDFNANGPVPKETEQTGIEDLMFGHEEDWEKKQTLHIELSEQQIFEMLSDPRLPEDTDYNYFTVVEISKEKESDFLELAKADDVDIINCISKDLGLYQVDFGDAMIEARGKTPKHIRLRSTLKKMLDCNVIIRTYEAKSYWINDEYENGKVVRKKHFDNSPYYIYHQPYWTNFLPVRMNVPKNPVKIDQLPEKLRDRVLKIPVKFEHTESFQPAQWSLCDAYYDDEDLIIVDGYKYILLPLSDGTEAYINIDINPLDFFDYCSEKNKNGCTQCTSACCTCWSEQFTNRPTVMQIISPFTKNDYKMRVKSDVITQHSIIFPFMSKVPYHFKDGFWITEDVARKKVSDNLLTDYFLKNYKYLEDMIQIIRPRVIILDAKARKVLSRLYDLSNHEIEIAGEKYPMYFRSEIIYCRKTIEELAMMPYQGREFPHVISKEEASKWKV